MSKKSELVSQGVTLAQVGQAIGEAVIDIGGADNNIKSIINHKNLCKKIALVILDRVALRPTVIGSCDGSEILMGAHDVFDDITYDNCKETDIDEPGSATENAELMVHEIEKSLSFADYFSKLSSVDELCLTQHQIKKICRDYPVGSYSVFLFKAKEKFFIVNVCLVEYSLCLRISEFKEGYMLKRGDKLIVPKIYTKERKVSWY